MEPLLPNKIISVPDMFATAAKPGPGPVVARDISEEADQHETKIHALDVTDPAQGPYETVTAEAWVTDDVIETSGAENPEDRVIIQTKNNSVPETPVSKMPGITDQTSGPEISGSKINTEINYIPVVKKKGIKEYLVHGLITCLAVALGFIAWDKWEETIAVNQAAEFGTAYFNDIKKDTVLLQAAIRFNKEKLVKIDSAIAELHKRDAEMEDSVIAHGIVAASAFVQVNRSSVDDTQTKSLVVSKYFSARIASLINEYDRQAKTVVRTEDLSAKFITGQYFPFIAKYFNAEVGDDFLFGKPAAHKIYFTDRSAVFENQVINYLKFNALLRMQSVKDYEKMLTVSDKLLKGLKNEYGLANN